MGKKTEKEKKAIVGEAASPRIPIEVTDDFPSTKEGSFDGVVRPHYFKEPLDEFVLLLSSDKIPGLSIDRLFIGLFFIANTILIIDSRAAR